MCVIVDFKFFFIKLLFIKKLFRLNIGIYVYIVKDIQYNYFILDVIKIILKILLLCYKL